VLSPTSATNPVGQPHTLTGRVQDDNGNPIPNVTVTFHVTSGPNAGLTGTAVTDADGKATFTYTSSTAGTDQIIASFTGSDGMPHTSNVVTKTWTSTNKSPACDLTGTGVNASGNAFIDIRAQDTDNGLQSIVVTSSTNADTVVPPFSPGTTAPVVVRSTKITNGQGSNVALTVTDIAGTKTDCDPRVLQLKVGRRGVGRKTVRKLPRAESKVLIQTVIGRCAG
jgi:hypothetical protein